MIILDSETCTACGSCVKICHEHCLAIVGGNLNIDHALCSTCMQCIAVCPSQALSWDGVPPAVFEPDRLPSAEQIDELLRERRTIRFFKPDRLEPALVEEIVAYGIHAPTNNYHLRAILVDDDALFQSLDRACLRFTAKMYGLIYKPRLVFNLLMRLTPAIQPQDKVKMEMVLRRGYVLRRPPVMVLIVGDRWVGHSDASAQYALANMMLAAQVRGVGACLWGSGKMTINASAALRKDLRLQSNERVLGILLLGYPAVTFRNKVAGKALPFEWRGR